MYEPITYSLLKSIRTCQQQLDLIEKHFGKIKPIPLTKRVATKFGILFDIEWAVDHLLTYEDRQEYKKVKAISWEEYNKAIAPAREEVDKVKVTALEEYQKVTEPAWAEYKKATATAKEKYFKVVDPAYAKYKKVYATALEEYCKVIAPALEEFNKSKALTFIEIYKKGMK